MMKVVLFFVLLSAVCFADVENLRYIYKIVKINPLTVEIDNGTKVFSIRKKDLPSDSKVEVGGEISIPTNAEKEYLRLSQKK